MSDRYVVVDPATKHILGGPWLWDGQTPWHPPVEGTLLLESDAQAAGYTNPPEPPPVENWVIADVATQTILTGFAWDGQGDSPVTPADGQLLLREADALGQGYSYP